MFFWAAIVIICIVFRPYIISDIYRDSSTRLFIPEIGGHAIILSIPVLFTLGSTICELVKEYKSSPQFQKVRIHYPLLAIVIVWLGMFANGSSALRAYPIDVIVNIASAVLIALAILRYHLLDIDIVLRKGLVYAVSVFIMGVGYFWLFSS